MRQFSLVAVVCALSLAACTNRPARKRPTKPDLILITLDTTRADHLGIYGYGRPVSPHIDEFAHDAVLYRRAWSSSSWTLPAHASLLTGKQVTSHGAHNDINRADSYLGQALEGELFSQVATNRLPEDEITVAEILDHKGYATAAFAGGPWLAPPFGLLQGYQVQDAEVKTFGGRSAAELTDRALQWIATVHRDQPCHVLINYFDPHLPYASSARFIEMAIGEADSAPGEVPPSTPPRPGNKMRRSRIDAYDGEIRFMDYHLGRLFDGLRKINRYRNALIVVVGDHGELLGEHGGLYGHGRWLYEELIRVPLIVRFPGGAGAGRVVDEPVSTVDLFALIAGELGFEVPARSESGPPGKRRIVLAEWFHDAYSVKHLGPRVNRDLVAAVRWPWKIIVSSTGKHELFNLAADPTEKHNLQGREVEADLLAELARVYRVERTNTYFNTGFHHDLV